MTITDSPARRNHRPNQRELFCKAHLKQLIQGNGKKYYLHLLQTDQLQQRKQGKRQTWSLVTVQCRQQLQIQALFQRHFFIKANVIPKKTVNQPSRPLTA